MTESPCVSVIAPTAQEADIWATALSVLGSDGFERLPEGFEAMLIYPDGKVVKTQGFP